MPEAPKVETRERCAAREEDAHRSDADKRAGEYRREIHATRDEF